MLFPTTLATATSSEQLLFLRSSVFGTVTSSQQLFVQNPCFFGAKLLPRDQFLTIGGSLGQLLFGKTTFLAEELFRINISTEQLFFFKPGTSVQHQLFQKSCIFLKNSFPEKKYSILPICSKRCYSSYLFRRATFSQHTFTEELLLHSYAFSPHLQLLFISK